MIYLIYHPLCFIQEVDNLCFYGIANKDMKIFSNNRAYN